jgi:hypothetical protein
MRLLGSSLVVSFASALLACGPADAPAPAVPAVPAATALKPEPLRAAAPPVNAAVRADGTCGTICAKTAELGCGTELECLTNCGEMRGSASCSDEITQFLGCAAGTKPADWTCGDEAMPILREGVCDGEQGAIAACLERLAQR